MEGGNSRVRYHISTIDRISNLPWGVLDNILGRLPIKEAVRTSVLSRQWQYNWINLSKLDFDESCEVVLGDESVDAERFAKFVYHVLLSHSGQIQILKISPSSCVKLSESDLDNWIHFLLRPGIRDCIKQIVLRPQVLCKVPPCLFSCHQLTYLNTNLVVLELPKDFPVLRNLKTVTLQNFATNSNDHSVDADSLSNFIHHCPALGSLSILGFIMLDPFVIQCPKLQQLSLNGCFQAIVFENCPLLQGISLYKDDDLTIDGKEMRCNLFDYILTMSCLTGLELSGCFLQYLHLRDLSETHFLASNQLKAIALPEISIRELNEVKDLLTIFKLIPNVQHLYISIRGADNLERSDEVVEALSQSSSCFNALQSVEIETSSISEHEVSESYWLPELEFIKFVLAHSPILEKMRIVGDNTAVKHEKMFLGKLLFFKRASRKAKISFSYYNLM